MATPLDWSKAFAAQSLADLNTYDFLCTDVQLPVCQRLHFLQMACEKLAKAHLCAAGSDPETLQSSHAYIGKSLPIILRKELAQPGAQQFGWLSQKVPALAREIDLLAPAVRDAGRREANCEYPWLDVATNHVLVPAAHAFPNLRLVLDPSPARTILFKLIRAAVKRLV